MSDCDCDELRKALEEARPYVESESKRMYDGTSGHDIRKEAKRRLTLIDAALAAHKAKEVEYRMLKNTDGRFKDGDEFRQFRASPWEPVPSDWIGTPIVTSVYAGYRRPVQKEAR